jgi:hypothetical protein
MSASAHQLALQQLAEEAVIAVPLSPTIEWHDEQVVVLQLLEEIRRSPIAKDSVAQRAAHPVQYRGAGAAASRLAADPSAG